jgi:hypothetical protein
VSDPADGPTQMSDAVERAWRGYLDALEWARRFIFTREFCDRTEVREAANHFLMQVQAASYNWVMAPRVDYPRFYLGIYEPMVWNWALPSPDFRYRWAFIDGTQTYRIWGRRGDARFLDIQLLPSIGSVEKDAFRKLPTASYPVDQMHLEADGSFEIIASPEPHDGNWIRLDPPRTACRFWCARPSTTGPTIARPCCGSSASQPRRRGPCAGMRPR